MKKCEIQLLNGVRHPKTWSRDIVQFASGDNTANTVYEAG
jgi:hypothetical protein